MLELKRKLWELRKNMVGQVALTGAKSVYGAVMVTVEVIDHLCPLYWIYKRAQYEKNPLGRELETLDIFDEVKEHANNVKNTKNEIKNVKLEIREKGQEGIQTLIEENPLSEEVYEIAKKILMKVKYLKVKEQKYFILKINRVLKAYASECEELNNIPSKIYVLNLQTIKKLSIIEEAMDQRIINQNKLATNKMSV